MTHGNATPLALEARGLRKTFGATEALKGVDLDVRPGECVALLGENGAGKSTLVRIVSGEVAADDGAVEIAGKPLLDPSPAAAAALGVAVIHQELSFVGPMSVAENLFLSRLPRRRPLALFVDRARLQREARAALAEIAPHIGIRRKMADLRVADCQLVEIARAVASGASLILMDEPTSALNADEVEHLFAIVGTLKQRGVAILYISHRLDEIRRVADRVVVLRDGLRVAEHATGDATREQLVSEIVGKELRAVLRRAQEDVSVETEILVSVRDVGVPGVLAPMSFDLHAGQILGLYGLAGSGVESVAQAIIGGLKATGDVTVGGRRVRRRSPASCRKAGLALVPSDRRLEGLFPLLPVATNIAITQLGARGGPALVLRRQERALARPWIGALDVRPADPDLPISALSGGNQQKAIVARWLVTTPRAFVMDEPTKGIDVGAKSQMYSLIHDLAKEGMGILVISPDLPELMSISSHIGVVTRGSLIGIYATETIDEQTVVDLAIGGHAA